MNHTMIWSDLYLICFAVGFCLSFFSFVFGGVRNSPIHLPHFHGQIGGAHAAAGHAAGAPVPRGPAAVGADSSAINTVSNHAQLQNTGISPFNFVTLTAFLAWFGGTGYLLTRYSGIWVGFGLLASIASGLGGGGVVFLFLSRVLISGDENMDPADYEMVGVLGRISSSIRAGGTGEIIYTQMGTRRVCGARSDDGSAIAKGTEVVVTRYEKGIAHVRLWSEMSGGDSSEAAGAVEL
jgi:hypothetical protein